MHRISQLMSTPVTRSSGSEREHTRALSPTCLFPSLACGALDGDSSFECCSVDPLTGSHLTCRRSPRLLTNGYYIWTEDSFFCDDEGHLTLRPSQTSVMYKENLIRIFRKKKRSRHSLSSLFHASTSKSWLHGRIFGDAESSSSEDIWLEQLGRPDDYHCNESAGEASSSSLTGDWVSEELGTESKATLSPRCSASPSLQEVPQDSALQSQLMTAAEHFPKNSLDHSKTHFLQEASFQAILLAACLIFSACARLCEAGLCRDTHPRKNFK
ncbi:transmembrane protein 71 isoform X2 [Echinops telfairi]|uniref:Transmembrane protein 71 isoform X2 n=1 Tax=Echinops telfairi TaxID=9371 RepID=A0AC55CUZ8_ECHTE|nr:transmembrane protein 71 isoform X2 [Echinops telfairi]